METLFTDAIISLSIIQ